ncbi:MAG: DUF4342 domain-containing protein [Anaerolineae bacterium]|nr:DUF4342 domain-containing protein [Anaerolineae bacterium]MCA9888031.1 DUF4342 domain-containing protein [Anaerolineae bacterium]MCA9892535.1 DUF4342 domain-containing protein [Anaerolineae bacterium]MCB9461276.1 DUF4342 domain-containing protein [Anaerolineaceae bacterium]
MSDKKETWVEELEVSGKEVVEKVRELVQQGNVRRVIVRKKNGEELVELPLTPTVVGAGVLTVFAGPLMLLGAAAALLAELRIEVVREVDTEDDSPDIKQKIDVD